MIEPDIPPEIEPQPEDTDPLEEIPVSGPASMITPHWGSTTKLIIGLSVVAIGAFLLLRFMNIVGPLLVAFIFAYLLYPLAESAQKELHLSWRIAVTFIFIILLILFIGSIAIGGLAVIEQVQNLIAFLNQAVNDLPNFIKNITSTPLNIGPFAFDLSKLDINTLGQQVLGAVQPVLTQAGASVVSLASGLASIIGWMFFILLIAYFILAESGGESNRLFVLNIPGYAEDIQRIGIALGRIWNAFLRGQIIIVLLTIVIYNIILGSLGLKFFFGLAMLAGLARFVPYVGPFVAWTSYGLVAFFQGSTIFGLSPLGYAALIVGCAWVTDLVMDNFVSPRLMANALRVHPAAVMVSALIALNLLGVIGVILAAPVLATVKLFFDYIFAKMFDRDPWAMMETIPPPHVHLSLMVPAGVQNWVIGVRERISGLIPRRSK
jgi:predicted PurR-regulated permease PerM